MKCRDVQRLGEWPTDGDPASIGQELGSHLATCILCREELAAQRRLRTSLRTAFDRAVELGPTPDFAGRLRRQLSEGAAITARQRGLPRQWLALAAVLIVLVGLGASKILYRMAPVTNRLASDAAGDHWNCALKFRLIRKPVPLEEAARRFDPAFRLFLGQPPDTISTHVGEATVTERHSCAFDEHRFAHVILRYQGHVVSLLLTAMDANAEHGSDAIAVGGFTVLTAPAADHVLLLVSDLTRADLEPLAEVMSNLLVPQIKAADSISLPNARLHDAIAVRDVPPTFSCARQPS
ncbi:MAG TPA: hypothetical protein VF456_30215 [Vicinamibacterales bacterium]